MSMETTYPTVNSLEDKKQRGQEIRQKVTETVKNLFSRFGRGLANKSMGAVDISIGAVAHSIDKTVESAALVSGELKETVSGAIDANVERYNYVKEAASEKIAETKEAVKARVGQAVEGTKNLIDTGVVITQEVYTGAKNKILEAKQGALSFIERKKQEWAELRNKRAIAEALKKATELEAAAHASESAAESHRARAAAHRYFIEQMTAKMTV